MATVFGREHVLSRAAASHGTGGSGGGGVDEMQKRLTAVETAQAETKIVIQGLVTRSEFDQFRAEMRALFENLSGRIDAMAEKVNGRIDAMAESMNGRFDALTQKFNGRLDAMAEKINGRIDAMAEKLNGRIDAMAEKFSGRLAAIEAQLPHFATKADIANLHTSMIKWFIATIISCVSAVYIIQKLVH